MNSSFRKSCLAGGTTTEGRCFIVGEVAQSHDGSLGLAHAFIDAVARSGADAIKFQTHIASEESTPQEPWRVKFSQQDATRYEYWRRMEFSPDQWRGLKEHAEELGLVFLSTPFSPKAVEMLRAIGMRVWKVASGEIGNLPLLEMMVEDGGPVILSSGMSDWAELDAAVELVQRRGNPLAVLQCTSAYPCPPERVGLNLLAEMKERYSTPVGLSDHSGKIFASLAAVALGAEVVEVHVTLSRQMFGPDVPASVTSEELTQLVTGVREIERIVQAPVSKEEMATEMEPLRKLFTKSVVAGGDLPAGTVIRPEHLKLKKPGSGLQASYIPELVGRRLGRSLKADEFVQLADFEN